MALGALTFATYRAYQSAFGDPRRLDELSPQPLTGLAIRLARARRRAAEAAQDHLRDAVGASLIAVALLALATGFAWFAPVSNASNPGRVCVLMKGKPVAELAGDSVSVKSIQTSVSIRRCQ